MENLKNAIIAMFEGDTYGIAIDPILCNKELGKLKSINYPNFKYIEGGRWIENKKTGEQKNVHFIQIINIPKNLIKEIERTINSILETKDITVAEAINEIIDYFKKVKFDKEYKKQLIGDIAEALFVLECCKNNIDIQPYIRCDEDENIYDFIINNFNIEVKSSSKEKNEFYLTYEQLVQSMNKEIVICKFKKIANESNIIDIYNEIRKYGTLCDLLCKREKYWLDIQSSINEHSINNLLDNYSVNLDDVKISIFKKELLPEIKVINKNACNKIDLVISCTSDELLPTDSLFKKIRELINKK